MFDPRTEFNKLILKQDLMCFYSVKKILNACRFSLCVAISGMSTISLWPWLADLIFQQVQCLEVLVSLLQSVLPVFPELFRKTASIMIQLFFPTNCLPCVMNQCYFYVHHSLWFISSVWILTVVPEGKGGKSSADLFLKTKQFLQSMIVYYFFCVMSSSVG